MASIARWCFRHRFTVILIWIAGLVGLSVASGAAGNAYANTFSASGSDSEAAADLLQQGFPSQSGDVARIVWRVESGSVSDPEVQSQIAALLDEVGRLPHVVGAVSPYDPEGAGQISQDQRIAFAVVNFDAPAEDVPLSVFEDVVAAVESASTDDLQIEAGGLGIGLSQQQPPSLPTAVAILAAGVVLFIAFGSLFAMLLPLISAILALGAATAVIGLLSHAMGVSTIATTLAALIGLGVGVDYALFVVTRHRNGLKAGRTPEESAVTALDTAGRAVLFAGIAVCIALLGLLVLGVDLIDSLAIPAAITVLFTVLAAVTLLPALLRVFGVRVLSRRERRRLAAEGPQQVPTSTFAARWAESVRRRRVLLTGAVVAVVVILSLPFPSIRLGQSDQGNDPESWTTRQAYDLLVEGFGPGFNGPLVVAVQTPGGPADQATVETLRQRIEGAAGVASVSPALSSQDGQVQVVQVVPATSPQDEATTDLIAQLRDEVIPEATRDTGVTAHVGGSTATFGDFGGVLRDSLPLFLAVIVALGFVLLMVAFRSLLVPLIAAVMNVVAVSVTFGILTAAFQWGWLQDLTGFGGEGPIDPTLPVLMIAILFGLSMDYQVFLVSRMHEEWTHARDNTQAVIAGQRTTGRVITVAATVMILVFCSFALIGERLIAEFGIGLAIAVLFDAFVVRSVLVPALMHLCGPATWWLPRWLDRILPQLSVERPDPGPVTPVAQPVPERIA